GDVKPCHDRRPRSLAGVFSVIARAIQSRAKTQSRQERKSITYPRMFAVLSREIFAGRTDFREKCSATILVAAVPSPPAASWKLALLFGCGSAAGICLFNFQSSIPKSWRSLRQATCICLGFDLFELRG